MSERMSPVTIAWRSAATVAVVAVVATGVPVEVIVVVARAVGMLLAAALVAWYARVDWHTSRVGRTTMAIKVAVLTLAVAANLRTVATYTESAQVEEVATAAIAGAWLLVTLALGCRLHVMRSLRRKALRRAIHSEEEP